jgi:hypothetical protein
MTWGFAIVGNGLRLVDGLEGLVPAMAWGFKSPLRHRLTCATSSPPRCERITWARPRNVYQGLSSAAARGISVAASVNESVERVQPYPIRLVNWFMSK